MNELATLRGLQDEEANNIIIQWDKSKFIPTPPDPCLLDHMATQYKSEVEALNELVDNAIDADATEIVVRVIGNKEGIEEYRITDNGCGIKRDTMVKALSLAGKTNRTLMGNGKYGKGLKAAGTYLGEYVEIYTIPKDGSPGTVARFGTKLSKERGMLGAIVQDISASEKALFTHNSDQTHGTMIRIVDAKSDRKTCSSFRQSLREKFGITYYNVLGKHKIYVRGDNDGKNLEVKPYDPTGYTVSIYRPCRVSKGWVKYKSPGGNDFEMAAIMIDKNNALPEDTGKGRRATKNVGFTVIRNGRVVATGQWKNIVNVDKANLNGLHILLRYFGNDMDDEIGLASTKNKVSPVQSLRDFLADKTQAWRTDAYSKNHSQKRQAQAAKASKKIDPAKAEFKQYAEKEAPRMEKYVNIPATSCDPSEIKGRLGKFIYEFELDDTVPRDEFISVSIADEDVMKVSISPMHAIIESFYNEDDIDHRCFVRKLIHAYALAYLTSNSGKEEIDLANKNKQTFAMTLQRILEQE